jgi:chemotaxis protein methyltransferase CheR
VATDADATMLRRAQQACYALGSLKDLPAPWRSAAFFYNEGSCVTPGCRSGIDFQLQDVRRQMPDGPFDLILCRNLVFTYFEASLQADLLRRMLDRLRPSGFLVIGKHESLPVLPRELAPTDSHLGIYQRVSR